MTIKIKGYRREDGTVAIRNHVLILPSVFCANRVCLDIAANVDGTIGIEHGHGCGQIGADKEQTQRTIVNYGLNPNVYAVIIVGLGCEGVAARKVAAEIKSQSSKPVRVFTIQGMGGTPASIAEGCKLAEALVKEAKKQERVDILLSEFSIGIVPNKSEPDVTKSALPVMKKLSERFIEEQSTVVYGDSKELHTSYEQLKDRCINEKVAHHLSGLVKQRAITNDVKNDYDFVSSVGQVTEVVDYAERFKQLPGIVWMNGPSHELEQITGLSASGVHLLVMATGYGNALGSPVVPVVKVAANHELYEDLAGDLDFDAGEVLLNQEKVMENESRLFDLVCETMNGKQTASEELEISDFAINRVARSI